MSVPLVVVKKKINLTENGKVVTETVHILKNFFSNVVINLESPQFSETHFPLVNVKIQLRKLFLQYQCNKREDEKIKISNLRTQSKK